NFSGMRSCTLVRWRLSRACTLRASVQSKRSCIAPWTTHGLRSESCACASGSRKRPHLSSILTSRTFGGYGHQRREPETAGDAVLVVRVNSDQIDKLGVAAHQSFSFRIHSNGRFRLPWRFLSHPCRPAVRDPRLAPSDRRAPALPQAPQAHPPLTAFSGLALFGLERLRSPRFHHPACHGDWLAA